MVVVRRLPPPAPQYDGWRVDPGPSQVGDVGTVMENLETPAVPNLYVVESSRPEGTTVRLGDFTAEEIEALVEVQPRPGP